MLYANIQAQSFIGSKEDDVLVLSPYMSFPL